MPDGSVPNDDERAFRDRIRFEHLRELNRTLPAAIAVSTCIAIILVSAYWSVSPPAVLVGWLTTHLAVSAGRLTVVHQFTRRNPGPEDTPRWVQFTILGAFAAGLVWGGSSMMLFLQDDPFRNAFLLICVAGISAGAVTMLGTIRPAALAFLIPTLLPLIASFLILDQPLSALLAVVMALALAGTCYMASRIARKSADNTHLRLQVEQQRDDLGHRAQQYQALVESTSAILWEGDPETFRFTFVSGEAESLLGYPQARWIDEPTFWVDHIHPDDAEWAPDYCARATAEKRQHTFDYRMISADGRTVWLRDIVTVLVEDDRPVKLVGVMIDITGSKEAEIRLRRQEEHYRTLVESTSAIFWEENPDTLNFTFVSREAEHILGYPVDKWLESRQFWIDHLHPDDRESVPRKYEEDFRTHHRCAYDYRMIANDGRVVWLRDVATVLMDDGRPVKNVGVMFDITETKQAEATVDYLSGLQGTLVQISRQILVATPAQFDEVINESLARIGSYCEVDRAYLFRFKDDMTLMDNTHEWCANGISPEIANLQDLPRESVPNVVDIMEGHGIMHVPRVADLGPDWAREREIFEEEDIQSLVVVPVLAADIVQGFIGFDSVRHERTWSDPEIRLLRVLGDLIGAALAHEHVEHALRESEALRSHAESLAHLGSWEWDVEGDIFSPSSEWRYVTGCRAGRLTRDRVLQLAYPDDVPAVRERLACTLEKGVPYELEHRIVREDNREVRWISVHAELKRSEDGRRRLVGFIQDITDRRLAEEAVADSEERYRTVLNSISEVVYQTDATGNYTFLNPAWEEITGYPVGDSLETHFLEYVHPDDREYSREEYQKFIRGEQEVNDIEVRYLTREGQIRWVGIHSRMTRDDEGRFLGCTGTLRDVTERREAEEQMAHLAQYDALTDLPNRMLALDRLEQAIKSTARTGKHVATLFLDLDHFKKVNDTLGHVAGDEILVEASRKLNSAVRSQDTVARLGGDEFLVVLGDLNDSTDAQTVAQNLLHRFREPFMVNSRELVLTASIGIAVAPTDGDSATELLRNADTAMYQSKHGGRNTFHFFTAAMNREVARRLSIEEQLRGALEGGEFEIFYQPLVRLHDRSIIGAEALLRWTNPELGAVSPAEFIPIAEQTGQINAIGNHVLEEAVSRVAQWRRIANEKLRVSVNVSPQQFRDAQLIERLDALLAAEDLPGDAIEVEITEGVLLGARAEIGRVLKELRDRGVGIAMDDFGTGYASLSYLRDYPFDTLKIDQRFVRDINRDANDRELVITSLRLAQALGLTAIAEGIESEDQLRVLLEHGCKVAQGYLFGRPMSAENFARLLDNP